MRQLASAVTIRKNNVEDVRIGLIELEHHARVHIRIFAEASRGDCRPTAQGISLKASPIPELRAAIVEIEANAQRLGPLGERRSA